MSIEIIIGLPHLCEGPLLSRARALQQPVLISANCLSIWSTRRGWREWTGWKLHHLANAHSLHSLVLDSADDDVDWWADPKAELDEINRRNVLIVGLTFDGFYDLDIIDQDTGAECYSLRFPSGKIFIGPGEVMTGGGDEPDESCSGIFLDLPPGDYNVSIARSDDRLRVSLKAAAPSDNDVIEPIRI